MSQNTRPAQAPEKQGTVHGPKEAPEKWGKPPQSMMTPEMVASVPGGGAHRTGGPLSA